MVAKTWTSIELKKALEKDYEITYIYSALEYPKMDGLMKDYVANFLKMKIENSGTRTAEECNEINKNHRKLGFDFVIDHNKCQKNE